MSITSKSPKTVAAAAYEAGKAALPEYAHKFSRKDYTYAQLFAILVLRKFFKQDYRGTAAFLAEWSDLRGSKRGRESFWCMAAGRRH